MAKIPQEAQELFNEVPTIVFATASKEDAQPNVCMVTMKKIIDDETIYLSDQFFKKTLANIKENSKAALSFWNDEGAYEIYGTMRYVNEGDEFEEQATWVNATFEQMGVPIKAKGGVFIHVDAVYNSAGGPSAGTQIA